MKIDFDQSLAQALEKLYASVKSNGGLASSLKNNSTKEVKDYLVKEGVNIPTPDLFHAHIIGVGQNLPDEPQRASIDRYIYIFKENGLFEFKTVPGKSGADDSFMKLASGACQCCNCCVFELQ